MKKRDAALLNIALLQISQQLKQVYKFVAEKDAENLDEFKKRFANVLGRHVMELELPLWDEFPELKPEEVDGPYKIDSSIYNESIFNKKDDSN